MNELPYVPYNSANTQHAKKNRKKMTKAESRLWFEILKDSLVGYKFIRQKMIDSFILDFYCSKVLLGIEVDGSSHDNKQDYDTMREEKLRHQGIKIIRYRNEDVLDDIESVYEDIKEKMQERKDGLDAGLQTLTPQSGASSPHQGTHIHPA